MIIICTKCSTHFNLDDSLVKKDGSKCRCSVCSHIFKAYPLSPEPESWQPEPGALEMQKTQPEQFVPHETEPEQFEPQEIEPEQFVPQETESESFDYNDPEPLQPDHKPEISEDFDFESDEDDDDLSETNSDIEMDNPYLEMDENDFEIDETDLEIDETDSGSDETDSKLDETDSDLDENGFDLDDDFSFEEDTFEMEEENGFQKDEVQENHLDIEDDDIKPEPIEDDPIYFDDNTPLDELELEAVDEDEPENEESIISPDPQEDKEAKPPVKTEKNLPENDNNLEEELKKDLPEKEIEEIALPPKKERKVIVKPKPFVSAKQKPVVSAKPKPIKKEKKSSFRTIIIILILIFLLAIGAYIASIMTGYKLPVIDQYIKKPIPEISEAKPIPNQKSVNGRFVTNSTAGTLFIITGRVENPSNIAYSHIEIRGALITKNKEEAKVKNSFCGNIITEEMLKTGNISDINTLLSLKEGAHKINVNIGPGANVPFMVVFSDLPEKLQNFTVKVAGFDKAIK
ncbi:MAG: DUF3426 domain-containing protein [Desulfobacula sp.]|jgi:predicted Zn finger-like uncharacterized protein|uniref:zinc-ribbon domain-containing protein n=1 Tax=Desulfobacula sp. TaxID=2593537 RepID=UPI001DAF4E21|nr:DUF3426 domain-containing protein [Desulfobacula sp.]MBT3485857.1 DUF3426 domain-containing protein [Desulfobacula sp.]MBT3804009.1 DUF3426 domain-containing protein [Desulfobacula sp.]MBT4023624.1 DUF3426 domain-containing protein [Desulfobacula sp.]MBT4197708.1 DUF3426 domain-containing protein [Desulfobacula sp.]